MSVTFLAVHHFTVISRPRPPIVLEEVGPEAVQQAEDGHVVAGVNNEGAATAAACTHPRRGRVPDLGLDLPEGRGRDRRQEPGVPVPLPKPPSQVGQGTAAEAPQLLLLAGIVLQAGEAQVGEAVRPAADEVVGGVDPVDTARPPEEAPVLVAQARQAPAQHGGEWSGGGVLPLEVGSGHDLANQVPHQVGVAVEGVEGVVPAVPHVDGDPVGVHGGGRTPPSHRSRDGSLELVGVPEAMHLIVLEGLLISVCQQTLQEALHALDRAEIAGGVGLDVPVPEEVASRRRRRRCHCPPR